MMRSLFGLLLLLATTHGLRAPSTRSPVVRGGASEEEGLFGKPEEESMESKLRKGMVTTAGMMRGMGSSGPAVDALEAAAQRDDAGVPELLELYLVARLEQSRELSASGDDQFEVAVRQVAMEAIAYKASGALPEAPYVGVMTQLATECGVSDIEAFEADMRERSAVAVKELLEVLSDNGNFVAKALSNVGARIPLVEADVAEDLAAGNTDAVAQGQEVLAKFRAWQNDSAPLESLRLELLNQMEAADDPVSKGRVAMALRPVVANILGPDFSS